MKKNGPKFAKAGGIMKWSSSLVSILCLLIVADSAQGAISRVARRVNVFEFYVSYAHPVGQYDHIDIIDFENSSGQIVDLDADEVYDPSYSVGFNFGQIRNDRMYFGLGFRYTKINTLDTFYTEPGFGWAFTPETPEFNLYDFDFDLNYYFNNPTVSGFSPYIGLGFDAGILRVSGDIIDPESQITLGLGLNFGADVIVWEGPDNRSSLALASVNEYQFLSSEDRPRFLNIGGAFKYYFRP